MPLPYQSILAVIESHANVYPDKIAYRFLNDKLVEIAQCSYAKLIERAKTIAKYLVHHSATGERVLLLFNPGLDFIVAFLGCLYAGCFPVPCYSARVVIKNLKRFLSIIEDADARFLLTDDSSSDIIADQFPQGKLLIIHVDEALNNDYQSLSLPEISRNDIAFIQYTSGSTGQPCIFHSIPITDSSDADHEFHLMAIKDSILSRSSLSKIHS